MRLDLGRVQQEDMASLQDSPGFVSTPIISTLPFFDNFVNVLCFVLVGWKEKVMDCDKFQEEPRSAAFALACDGLPMFGLCSFPLPRTQ